MEMEAEMAMEMDMDMEHGDVLYVLYVYVK
jgi:hypothetical protein